ncbi:hypothetical protein EDC94DRAFT_630795 [Helicostylum pulchrum]|nr:hypothetical protein EDC94DRAFT_630795 [Helicostylum pulchrum]
MTNNKHIDTMHNNNAHNRSNNNKPSVNNNTSTDNDTITRMHPSMKRPRAPIACYRCHHKKVRCDGVHPNCTRCLSTGVLCAYPSSRRSRNSQPTNVDPFIDNLSQLEARIRRIETDLESQRALVRTVCARDTNSLQHAVNNPPSASASAVAAGRSSTNNSLTTRMLKTEKDLQESRSIVAQLRLRGEQRAARGKRAAAAAAASVSTCSPGPDKNTVLSGKSNSKEAGTQPDKKRIKLRVDSTTATTTTKKDNMTKSPYNNTTASVNDYGNNAAAAAASPPFYFTQSNSSSPADFINPTPSYYFPYSPNHQYTTGTDITPICGSSGPSSSAPFTMMVSDWPLLNDLPHNTTVHNNGFVDPMIIAAAEAHQHGIAPPLLSVSSYMGVDEKNSIMTARAKSLSHLPQQHNNMMAIPGLQTSSSSTSTCSNNSTNFANYNVYGTSYANFMGSNTNDTMMMMDQQQNIR